MAEIDYISAAIPAGATGLSAEIDIGNKSLVGLVLPSGWLAATGGISMQASVDGTNFYEVTLPSGSAYIVAFTGAGPAYIGIDPTILRGIVALKLRSGLVGAAVNQTGAPVLTLVTRLAL